MKKAVIATGGKQYLVAEGETVEVELLKGQKAGDKPGFEALMVIDDNNVNVGKPFVDKVRVAAEIVEPEIKNDKVTAIRYKAKKRVLKVRGHRQRKTLLKITEIA